MRPYHVITPTAHPLEALALSLTRDSDSVTTAATLIDDLARDSRSLHLLTKRATHIRGASHVLLVVDQFEELFTLCRDEAMRKAFIDNLLTAAAPSPVGAVPTGEGWGGGERPTIVVITLRADFYAHCAEHAPLRDALAKHQEYIGRMSAEELRRAIEEPAKRGGWTFEPGLVDMLMRETGSEPGGLPLLSHALLETWQRRRGRTLTLRSYAESGGVHGAIAKTAESVYQRFTPEQQAIARNVFIRLTELGEGTQDTRRRAALDELTSRSDDMPDVGSVLNILAGARLITLAEETAEVAHEALIREWPTLRQWLSEDREGLRQHRHLTEAAREWEALGRDPGELYRGARLAQAVEWAETHAGELNALERAYLDASREWAEREAAEREAQRRREVAAAQRIAEAESRRAAEQSRAARQLRRRTLVLAGALVAAGVLTLVAIAFGAQAEQESRLATSRELAAAAIGNLDVDAERSILLALQGMSAADTLEAQDALHRAVQASHVQLALGEPGRTPAVWGIAFSPDGQWLATADSDGTGLIRDAATGDELLSLVGHTGELSAVAFSPDGMRLATAGEDGTVRVWNAANGEELLTLAAHSGWIGTVAFSPDGTRLATAGEDGTAKVWDAASGRELIAFTGHSASVDHVAFSPDGEHLATVSADGTTKVWGAASGDVILTLDDTQLAAAFSPDGTRLAVSGFGGVVRVWDLPGSQLLREWRAHSAPISDIAFSPTADFWQRQALTDKRKCGMPHRATKCSRSPVIAVGSIRLLSARMGHAWRPAASAMGRCAYTFCAAPISWHSPARA